MTDNNKDIPSNRQTDNDKLMNYLNNQLENSERHQIEQDLENDPFAQEAMEGLELIQTEKIPHLIDEINLKLRKEIKKGKRKKRNNIFSNQSWIYFAVTLILLLLVITYLVFRKMNH